MLGRLLGGLLLRLLDRLAKLGDCGDVMRVQPILPHPPPTGNAIHRVVHIAFVHLERILSGSNLQLRLGATGRVLIACTALNTAEIVQLDA